MTHNNYYNIYYTSNPEFLQRSMADAASTGTVLGFTHSIAGVDVDVVLEEGEHFLQIASARRPQKAGVAFL